MCAASPLPLPLYPLNPRAPPPPTLPFIRLAYTLKQVEPNQPLVRHAAHVVTERGLQPPEPCPDVLTNMPLIVRKIDKLQLLLASQHRVSLLCCQCLT